MPEAALLVLIGILGVLGFAGRRWWIVVTPFFAIPVFYLGLEREWWGHGLGDGWQYAMVGVLTIAVAVTSLAIALRRELDRRRG